MNKKTFTITHVEIIDNLRVKFYLFVRFYSEFKLRLFQNRILRAHTHDLTIEFR